MDPNNFIINTDFLTLAKSNSAVVPILIPGARTQEHGGEGGPVYAAGSQNLTMTAAKGAYLVSAARMKVGESEWTKWQPFTGRIAVEKEIGYDIALWSIILDRIDVNTLRVYWECETFEPTNVPLVELELAITSFYPPNVI